jgi:tetratricopeptide (TPR) repeat protein
MPSAHEPFEHEHLGSVLRQRGLPDRAAAHFRAAIALDPSYAPSHFQLARYFAEKSDFERADAHFDKGLRLAPSAYPARLERASVLVKLGRRSEAADQLGMALVKLADSPQRRALCVYALMEGLEVPACR